MRKPTIDGILILWSKKMTEAETPKMMTSVFRKPSSMRPSPNPIINNA
jgi:hypothetical protein